MSEPTGAPSSPPPRAARRPLALHWRIFLGLLVGAVAGLAANLLAPRQADGTANAQLVWWATSVARPLGVVFLRLVFMVVVPLVFAALALGVAQIGDVRRLGRMGLRTLLLTVVFSAASVGIGLTLVNLMQPGLTVPEERRAELRQRYAAGGKEQVARAAQAKPLREALLDIIPENPLQEAVGALDGSSKGGGMLAVMFFALVFGVALTLAPGRAGPLLGVLEGLFDVCLVIIGFAMRLAPYCVVGLAFWVTALLGMDVLRSLAWFVATVLAGLALHLFGVYSLLLALLGRLRPWLFFRRASDALVTAFATSSSNATLPTALRVSEEQVGVRPEIGRFVLTVGATGNQNGTALYEGVTVLFLAQLFGVDLTLQQQVTVALMSILAGIGTAGVPGGSLPLIVLLLQSVGIPGEGIGVILGIDRLLDMCRTTVNVAGDMAIAACVHRAETGEAPAPG
ncbi:MAG: dicarboxylate/amino acid:cation symporter [Candidatus Latescibacterota bacterium]